MTPAECPVCYAEGQCVHRLRAEVAALRADIATLEEMKLAADAEVAALRETSQRNANAHMRAERELAALQGKLERTVGYWNDTRAERGEYMERAESAERELAALRLELDAHKEMAGNPYGFLTWRDGSVNDRVSNIVRDLAKARALLARIEAENGCDDDLLGEVVALLRGDEARHG